MYETVSTLMTLSNSLETGLFDSNSNEQNEKVNNMFVYFSY